MSPAQVQALRQDRDLTPLPAGLRLPLVYNSGGYDSLRTLAPTDALPLGTQPDGDYAAVADRLERGEMLVAISDGVHRALRGTRERVLWRLIQSHRDLDADELIRKARAFLDRQPHEGGVEDQTILVVKRLATP